MPDSIMKQRYITEFLLWLCSSVSADVDMALESASGVQDQSGVGASWADCNGVGGAWDCGGCTHSSGSISK